MHCDYGGNQFKLELSITTKVLFSVDTNNFFELAKKVARAKVNHKLIKRVASHDIN